MSKKPVKKSDQDKNWMPKRKGRYIKSQLGYHLIVCEGTETEPKYFQAIKENITEENRKKLTIKIVGKGRGTNNLLDAAIKEVRKCTNYISDVWVIYDKDEFSNDSFNDVKKRCEKLNKEGDTTYHAIWSNECIETWILLHFIRLDTPLNRKDCIKKINENFKKKGLGRYTKDDELLYDKLKPYLNNAIENAKWLEGKYDDSELPSEMNPCTKVYKLVELLNKYTEKLN